MPGTLLKAIRSSPQRSAGVTAKYVTGDLTGQGAPAATPTTGNGRG